MDCRPRGRRAYLRRASDGRRETAGCQPAAARLRLGRPELTANQRDYVPLTSDPKTPLCQASTMIEWIIAAAVGTPLVVAAGIAIYKERRQIDAIREASERLQLELIRSEDRFPRMEGAIDGIPVAVFRKHEEKSGHLVAQTDPKGLPPEVTLTLVGPPSDAKRKKLEARRPRARIESVSDPRSPNPTVLDALLQNQDALEVLWQFHCVHPYVKLEFGEIIVRLGDFNETEELMAKLRDIASRSKQLQEAFERQPIIVR